MAPRFRRTSGITSLLAATITGLGVAAVTTATAGPAAASPPANPASGCHLANGIRHVVQIQFDNVHLTRDNPRVPSDLQRMPNLLHFLTSHGVMLTNAHNDLVHTATNFVSNQTGLYPDRTAIAQSNSFYYYARAGTTHPGESFTYWTDPIDDPSGVDADTNYNVQYAAHRNNVPNRTNINAPAPWVPYTRDGCDVGEIGMGNTVLESLADIPLVFGPDSPQAAEAKANPDKATADYIGFALHCARSSPACSSGQRDILPDEPGGYHGYRALFGNADVRPVISPSGPVRALNGTVIKDAKGNVGFPGFDSETPTNSLGYAAQMLEHGVADVNVYVSDAHGDHSPADTGDFGPGERGYEAQLAAYNRAFGQFFARLARDGITPANTLFAVTTDEGDHFSGSAPTPAGCTGLPGHYCDYATRSEVNVNLPGLLATEKNDTTPFAIHSDPAPALWVQGNPPRTAPQVRQLERDISGLTITNPLTGRPDKIAYQMADPVEEKILHFVSSDPARTPTLTAFSGEDEYVGSGPANCAEPCVYTSQGYAWNHGGLWPDMQDIWAAYAGPGIAARGYDRATFTDQVDMRPTLLALTGLRDDYPVDGRVLVEIISARALPHALREHRATVLALGRVYKQILATTGRFGADTLTASTRALASGSPGSDSAYARTEAALSVLGTARNRLAGQISRQLLGAAFRGHPVRERQARVQLLEAHALLAAARALAG